jgi:hypothetical protein
MLYYQFSEYHCLLKYTLCLAISNILLQLSKTLPPSTVIESTLVPNNNLFLFFEEDIESRTEISVIKVKKFHVILKRSVFNHLLS